MTLGIFVVQNIEKIAEDTNYLIIRFRKKILESKIERDSILLELENEYSEYIKKYKNGTLTMGSKPERIYRAWIEDYKRPIGYDLETNTYSDENRQRLNDLNNEIENLRKTLDKLKKSYYELVEITNTRIWVSSNGEVRYK